MQTASHTPRTTDPMLRPRLLRRSEVERLTGLGCSRIYALMSDPAPDLRFPRPITIGRSVRWLTQDIDRWIEAQVDRDRQPTV